MASKKNRKKKKSASSPAAADAKSAAKDAEAQDAKAEDSEAEGAESEQTESEPAESEPAESEPADAEPTDADETEAKDAEPAEDAEDDSEAESEEGESEDDSEAESEDADDGAGDDADADNDEEAEAEDADDGDAAEEAKGANSERKDAESTKPEEKDAKSGEKDDEDEAEVAASDDAGAQKADDDEDDAGGAAARKRDQPDPPDSVLGESPPDELNRVKMGKPDWRHSLAAVLLAAAVFVPQMGSYGMFDPWETHYTEVARQFMVRNDWLSTYWHNGQGPDGWSERNFWSKPVGSFWMSGLSLKVFGYSAKTTGKHLTMKHPEWAVRLPFFLCALFGIFCIYLMCSRLFSKRAGLLAAVVLTTAPMYFMIGRQAMTDMPYVGLMSGGIALFMLGVFGERDLMPRREKKVGRWVLSWPHARTYYIFLLAFCGFMFLQLYAIIPPLRRVALPFKIAGMRPSGAAIISIYIVLAALLVFFSRKIRTRNEVYLLGFYMAVGIAGLAKGLIGALQPGLVVLCYILASREWRILTDVCLGRGLLVAACIFWPWYHAMVMRYGRRFWNELFGTEQLRRLTIGEQAQAKGTFEYYIKQIGYGLFPWVAFLPAGLVRAFGLGVRRERSARDRARLFVTVWFLAAVMLFTLTLTKYHHYILPAIPPGAILVALWLDDFIEKRVSAPRTSVLIAIGVLAIVAFDLVKQPAHWVWMFTYLYTSNWARGVPGYMPILVYSIVFGLLLLALFAPKLRKTVVYATAVVAIGLGGYVLNWYIVGCAPHWSQKRVLQTYYKTRKSPKEKLIAWQFNWRGETWYTAATVVVSKSLKNDKIIKWLRKRKGTKFFFITERSRYGSLRSMLPTKKAKQTLHIVDDSNVHYVLAAADI